MVDRRAQRSPRLEPVAETIDKTTPLRIVVEAPGTLDPSGDTVLKRPGAEPPQERKKRETDGERVVQLLQKIERLVEDEARRVGARHVAQELGHHWSQSGCQGHCQQPPPAAQPLDVDSVTVELLVIGVELFNSAQQVFGSTGLRRHGVRYPSKLGQGTFDFGNHCSQRYWVARIVKIRLNAGAELVGKTSETLLSDFCHAGAYRRSQAGLELTRRFFIAGAYPLRPVGGPDGQRHQLALEHIKVRCQGSLEVFAAEQLVQLDWPIRGQPAAELGCLDVSPPRFGARQVGQPADPKASGGQSAEQSCASLDQPDAESGDWRLDAPLRVVQPLQLSAPLPFEEK